MMRLIVFLFVIATATLISCKKKEYQLGSDVIDQETLLEGTSIDTFDINSYTILENSPNNGSLYEPNKTFDALSEMIESSKMV